jgi:integrase
MRISEANEGFLICKTHNRKGDLSPKTIRLYRYLLVKLSDSLGNPDIETIIAQDLDRFMASLALPERGLSAYAQDNYFKAIWSLWRWAVETMQVPPAHAKLRQPLLIAELVIPYCRQDIKRIMAACEYTTRTCAVSHKSYIQLRQTQTRGKAIICVLLDTGLRIGDVTRLTMADLFLGRNSLKVVPYHSGKKSKPREVPFGCNAKRWLWQYRSEYKPSNHAPLFGLTTTRLTCLFTRLE